MAPVWCAQASAALEWFDNTPAGITSASASSEAVTSADLDREIASRGRSHADLESNLGEGDGDNSGGRGGTDKLTASGEPRKGWWKVRTLRCLLWCSHHAASGVGFGGLGFRLPGCVLLWP